ncbi:hypothetical protein SAMN05446635_0724 [Burkholderia sp. OK233]|nr:hypothetical protein SAMN05446635_0724 [Burkholderia sp. OK233]
MRRARLMLILFIAPAGLFRDGVARLLGDVIDGAEVKCVDYTLSPVDSGQAVDVLVLDGDYLPEALTTASASHHGAPNVPVLALLTSVDPQAVEQFISAGVAGHLGKSESSNALAGALRLLVAGGRYLPSAVSGWWTGGGRMK